MVGRLLADAVLPIFCFVLFCLYIFSFSESAALRSVVLQYVCAPSASRTVLTTVCVLLYFVVFLCLWRCRVCLILHTMAFPFLYGSYVVHFLSG